MATLDDKSDLSLIKEPDNPKDEMAIAAYLGDRRIGYVAADDNCKIWMFLTDERTPCKLIQKYEASFKVSFDNPKQLFENMPFEDIYKDKDGWIEKNRPIMEVPFIKDAKDSAYDWYRDIIVIKDFEEFVPDFRRKLAAKMITFVARKNSQGNYRYYLPYLNAAVAAVEDETIKNIIDTDGLVIAIPDVSKKTYPGGLHMYLNVARLKSGSPLISEFRAVERAGNNELVFYLSSNPANEGNKNEHILQSETTNLGNVKSNEQIEVKNEMTSGDTNHEFFDKIDKLTTDLNVFVKDTLVKSRRVLNKIHKHHYYGYRFDDLKEYAMFVKIFVMRDLCRIYKKLICSNSIYKTEGKILFMYAYKTLGEQNDISFELFQELCNPNCTTNTIVEYRKFLENFVKQQYEEDLPYYPKNDFLMHEILEDENVELMDMAIEYMELICQFATTVADAKGYLTDNQSKWLSQLSSKY